VRDAPGWRLNGDDLTVPRPVERRARIGFAAGRYIGVPNHIRDGITVLHGPRKARQGVVLGVLERQLVATLELYAYGKVVASLASAPARGAGVPGTLGASNELHDLTVASNKKMRGNAQAGDIPVIRMRVGIEAVRE
jgi:hypothetical protein